MKSFERLALDKITTIGFIAICVLTFIHNGSISLWDQDEAAYAGFAKNMIESGNYLIPEFTWSEIHRKPPLHFWLIAFSFKLFGISEFALRLFSALSILATYSLIWLWGKKLFSQAITKLAALILGTSLLVPMLAKVAVTDALILLFSTICALSVISILKTPKIKYAIYFWSSFSLGLLTKGPPIIIFTFGFLFLLILFDPRRKNLLKLKPWLFLPLALAPFAYWCYLSYLKDGGEFLNWMVDWYVLKRISGSVLGQTGPPGTHFLIIAVSFLLYIVALPKAIVLAFKALKKRQNQDDLVLALWFVASWLIYEFSPSKLPAYCIAAHVPLSILIGKVLLQLSKGEVKLSKFWLNFQLAIPIVLTIAILVASLFLELSLALQCSVAILLLSLVVFYLISKRISISKRLLSHNLIFMIFLFAVVYPQIDQVKNSSIKVAEYLKGSDKKIEVVYIGNSKGKPPSLPFYCQQIAEKVVVCKDQEKLLKSYSTVKNAAFVLNKEQKEMFMKTYDGIQVKNINSFYVDRKGEANYYVIQN